MNYLYLFLIIIGSIAMIGITTYKTIDMISERSAKRFYKFMSIAMKEIETFTEKITKKGEDEKKNRSMFDDILED